MNAQREHEREATPHGVVAPPQEAVKPRTLHFRRRRALWALGLEPQSRGKADEHTRN